MGLLTSIPTDPPARCKIDGDGCAFKPVIRPVVPIQSIRSARPCRLNAVIGQASHPPVEHEAAGFKTAECRDAAGCGAPK